MVLTFDGGLTEDDIDNMLVAIEESSLDTRSAHVVRQLDLLPLSDEDLHGLPPRPGHEAHQEGSPPQLVQAAPHHAALLTNPPYHLALYILSVGWVKIRTPIQDNYFLVDF